MRNDFMARPATDGLLAPMPFSAVLLSALLMFLPCQLANAQDALVPPDEMSDGEDGDFDGAPAPGNRRGSEPSAGALVPPDDSMATATKRETEPAATSAASRPVAQNPLSPTASSPSATQGQPAIQVAAHGGSDDIYSQWAANKIKKQQVDVSAKPHPLAANYPGHFVVVCEAGCRRVEQHIVYLEPRGARGPVYKTSSESSETETDVVACVGGCYGSAANSVYESGAGVAMSEGNSWLTTTSDASASAKPEPTGERWYDRMKSNEQNAENNASR